MRCFLGRVLIVDQENESTQAACRELERRGHSCTVVDNVSHATGVMQDATFDVVVMSTGVAGSRLKTSVRKVSKGYGHQLIVLSNGEKAEKLGSLCRPGVEVLPQQNGCSSKLGDRIDALVDAGSATLDSKDRLAQELAILRTQLAITGEGVIVSDSNGKTIHYNQAFLDMWGIPERLVKDRGTRDVLLECFASTNAGTVAVEIVFGDPDIEVTGKRLELVSGWVLQWSTNPVRLADDTVIGRMFVFRDLTAQIAAEEQVRFHANLLEEVPSAIIATTVSGHVRYWNRTAERLHGWTNAEVTGRDIRDLLFSKKQLQLGIEALQHLKERGRWHGELQLRRKTAPNFPALLTLIQISGIRGQPSLVVGVIMDMTERHALEGRLLHAQKMEAVGTLAGGLAHEFNNLLTVVLGSASLAKEMSDLDEGLAESMDIIERWSLRGRDLCTQLLSFTRKEKPKFTAINTLDTIAEVTKIAERTFPKEVRVSVETDDELPPMLADGAQVNQALMNLLINARDAMPDGGDLVIRATTSVGIPADRLSTAIRDESCYVRLEVADTGQGMSPEVVSRMFEPFFTTKPSGKGTGLGLAMVFSHVRAHRGQIRVWSQPGDGSTFALFLPIAADAPAPATRLTGDSGQLESFAGTERILVVDDEAMVRNVGARILRQFGYETFEAGSGREALEILDREGNTFGAILLDIIMPEMEGPEFFTKMRQRGVTAPVLLCSAYKVGGAVDDLLDQGASGFVQKPYRLQELLPALRTVLDNAKSKT